MFDTVLNKREIKIFLTFFIIYSFFVHWGGMYENSIFALTRAIVNEGRFEIDSYANQTTDRALYNGHYYSDKSPGVSFLAIPVYVAWKYAYNFFPNDFKEKYAGSNDYFVAWSNGKASIIEYINPGFFILVSMILVTIFTSSLFSALTVVLIYKISKYFTNNEKHRILLSAIYGMGSIAFPTALSVVMHPVGTFSIFLSFYLLFKIKQEKIKDNKYLLISSIFLGFSISSDFYNFFIAVVLFFYMILLENKIKQKYFIFLLGCLIGLLPFLVYNFSILGLSPTLLGKYNDRSIFTTVSQSTFNNYGFVTPTIGVLYQVLIGNYRGLLFYYPVFFLSFIGLYYMYKKFKIESILITIIFISTVIITSSRVTWYGGYSFGIRYLLPCIPFLTIPILFAFKDFNVKLIKIIIIILIAFSIFVNILSLQILEDTIIDRGTLMISEKYQKDIANFNLPSILESYYLPSFLTYGPRSLIFENLINGHVDVDIRDIPLSRDWKFPYNGGENHIPFLCLIPIIIVILFLWRKELA